MKIAIFTLGCPKNEVDSELLAGALARDGHELMDDAVGADVAVVNTCGFIQPAVEESLDVVLTLGQLKKEGKVGKIIVTGCLVQRYKEEIAAQLEEADCFFGSSDHLAVAAALKKGEAEKGRITVTDVPTAILEADPDAAKYRIPSNAHSAYVRLSEGCSRRCSFCIIPSIRGKARSRVQQDVVDEVKRLVEAGVKEIILIAQETTAYGLDLKDGTTIVTLLEKLVALPGAFWLRIMYTHPATIKGDFLDFFVANSSAERLIPYLDIPIQHADDAVLKIMRRGYGRADLIKILEKLRGSLKYPMLRATALVGHPGETGAAFGVLSDFVNEGWFDYLGCFEYWDEAESASFKMKRKVLRKTAIKRKEEIMLAQREITEKSLSRFIGKKLQVLVDGGADESGVLPQGRFYGQAPQVDGVVFISNPKRELKAGDTITVKAKKALEYDLEAVGASSVSPKE